MYLYGGISFIAGLAWLVGLGYLFSLSLKSGLEESGSENSVLAGFLSAFARIFFIRTKMVMASRQLFICRLLRWVLLVFLFSFVMSIVAVYEAYA